MFRRVVWDEEMKPYGERMYKEARYGEQPGFQKLDYAFRFGAWNVELNFALGGVRSNHGLYSWEGVSQRWKHWIELGGQVKFIREVYPVTTKVAVEAFH